MENKLNQIKPKLKQRTFSHLSRWESVAITRLKIGHTKITHQHLVLAEEAPTCIGCDCQLTVKHILIECLDYSEIRSKYYRSKNLKALFNTIEPRKIIGFIAEIGLLKRI